MDVFWSALGISVDIVILGIAVVSLILLLSFKKRILVSIVIIVVAIGAVYVYDRAKYITFPELVETQLNSESTVRDITITINDNDLSGDGLPVRKAHVTIEDEEIIKRILDDFSDLELKKNVNAQGTFKEYQLRLLIINPSKENGLVTDSLYLYVDEHYVNDFAIVGETDHLKTIKYLVESDEVEWEDLGE
ncbi:hypothetical protein [Sutcliffiella halmapala]|uniref:hypothetical protein n=1 Tax=Sutcliffiella halmapala TaxID=79882 RepID=UPI00099577F3|nr:hypothetical protein [Sutcliffiella halmapala]